MGKSCDCTHLGFPKKIPAEAVPFRRLVAGWRALHRLEGDEEGIGPDYLKGNVARVEHGRKLLVEDVRSRGLQVHLLSSGGEVRNQV